MKDNNNNKEYLDKLNNQRVADTRRRVAHAIKLCDNPVGCLVEGHMADKTSTDIAHAVNLLEAAEQDMRFACAHFEWNNEICDQIESACMDLGKALAILEFIDDDYDLKFAGNTAEIGLAKLGKALATLIRWNDDDVDDSEV